LEMLDSDPEVDSVIEGKTALSLMSGQISHQMERDFREGQDLVNVSPDWEDSHWEHGESAPEHIETRPYKKEDLSFGFCDDEESGFTVAEFLNYMLRSQFVMTRAYADAWTGHHSIESGSLQPIIMGQDPHVWEEAVRRALKDAHRFFGDDMVHRDKRGNVVMEKVVEGGKTVKRPKKRGLGTDVSYKEKLASGSPIYSKVRDSVNDFDTEAGVPVGDGYEFSSFPKVKESLKMLLDRGIINTNDYEHLVEFLDIENGGYGDQTNAFRDWRSQLWNKAWQLFFPIQPISSADVDLPIESNMPYSRNHKMSPYFPTLIMFGKHGGLNLDTTDAINLYLHRNADLGREIKQNMMELSDLDSLPEGFGQSAKVRRDSLPLRLKPASTTYMRMQRPTLTSVAC